MVVALNIELGEVEVTQSDEERVAEGIKIGLGLSVILTGGMTHKEEALGEGEMDNHVDDKENSHFSEHLDD
jgi:hypothetical protein